MAITQGLRCLLWCWVSFFFLNWKPITLQYCSGFCHTLTWISHGCPCVPHPEPPSHLPPHPSFRVVPVHQPWVPLPHASNLDWWSISHMIIYMFQCYSLKSPHPHLFPQSPSVLYICVSFAVSHIRSLLPSSKFHIYVLLYCISGFLSDLLHSV